MTTADETTIAPFSTEPTGGRTSVWLNRADRWVTHLNERLNPILVKEARQALKSRQFAITFMLVLLCAWVASILGLAVIGPSVHCGTNGSAMFIIYYVILAAALLIIVPFGAFRSLASEREDGTYELLSITTLRPYQIVSGKLGSAALQMLVYLSAIAPCLAFTYLLRGIDIPTIIAILVYTVAGSMALSVLGLLIATASTERHWQVVLSVLLVLGLACAFGIAWSFAVAMLSEHMFRPDEPTFWPGQAAFACFYASYFVLVFLAAAAQLTFFADNRSTKLRWVMFVQQALLLAWLAWPLIEGFHQGLQNNLGIFWGAICMSTIHWGAMGFFLTSEQANLSRRVMRQLPQSFLGRALFTWFNPGSGTGYMFVVTNLTGTAIIVVAGSAIVATFAPFAGPNWWDNLWQFTLLCVSYVTFYLGLGRLLGGLATRRRPSMGMRMIIQLALLAIGTGVPLSIHLMSAELRDSYSIIELTNPFNTLYETTRSPAISPDIYFVTIIMPILALLVLLANLPSVVAEVAKVRIATPPRVREDEATAVASKPPLLPSALT